ncbi:LysR family transcriptional regulator [Bordetella muralis]|jgi:LysR family transcriptional regulator, nitrogen assimilation regulatory protein|uniref:LysR family transcriptional regulator n=1 Tax=Bordetella muralis TaxID=1649130 RepID=UPI0039F101E2
MDLRQLQYFLAVAETLNVSRAATKVWISQPALSRQIQLLEDELQVSLFERKARGMALTEAGQMLRQRAFAVMKDITAIKEDMSSQALEPTGTVTIGVPSSLRGMLTKRMAARYASAFPKVLLRIHEGSSRDIRDSVASGKTDIAIFSTEEPFSQFHCTPLLTEKLLAIMPTNAGLSLDRPVDMRTLCRSPLILTSYPNSLRKLIEKAAAKAGVDIKVCMEVDMSALMLDLVAEGLGCAVLPYCAVHDLLRAKQISAAPVKGLTISWIVAYSRERTLSNAAQHLLTMVISQAQRLVEDGQWPTAIALPQSSVKKASRSQGDG